ncbi:hypothetical protein G7Z17_g5788 [Cylindrodendrum hubeiense]|uniref:Major facilitator superfamily (MFS) profile domain-containing protein n=1 Tax=Cylindrodendrum hubeiense TaxID=595255 RepID=A0A9P5HB61_9HYPO|nr:hypothetical protein G7Z17_g5788 [Cylindrodendrum hubeiense]
MEQEVKQKSEGEQVAIDRRKARRVVLKTDAVVLPLLTIAMTLGFLDKNALSFAAVWGLKDDTHLVGQEYSWLGSIFYFGYLFAEFPNLWLMTRVPLGKYIGGCLTAWGVALCLISTCHNFRGIATIRFFLGVFEASLLPCMMLFNSMWYRRDEQPLRTAFWCNTFAGVFGGILSYAIGKIDGSLSTWKYIFIIYGAVTVLMGIVTLLLLPDSPANAWFLNSEEKELAVLRLADNQTGVNQSKKMNVAHIKEALLDPKWLISSLGVFAYAITNASITNFNPLIIAGYGFSQSRTALMATPQAAIAMVAQASFSAVTLFVPNLRCFFWVLSSCIALAGAIMVHVLDATVQRNASLAGVYFMGFYNPPFIMAVSLQTSNNSGTTKKSFVSASIAIFYALGNIVGPQFFREAQAPRYQLGIGALLCSFAVMAACGIAYALVCIFENKKRDEKFGKPKNVIETGLAVEHEDLTDIQNANFRYTL